MSRKRVTYQTQALYVGPAPSTGYHFMTIDGSPSNSITDHATGHEDVHNLIQQVNRVHSASWSFTSDRLNIATLGRQPLVDQTQLEPPSLNFSFAYYSSNLRNEARMGLNVNFPTFVSPLSGVPFFSDNYSVNLLEGFSQDHNPNHGQEGVTEGYASGFLYPKKYRDKRNFFLNIFPEGYDAKDEVNEGREFHTNCVIFTDCLLTQYEVAAAVGELPSAKVSYSSENVAYITGSSGQVPALDPVTRKEVPDLNFKLPNLTGENLPSIIMPGDISLSITSPKYGASSRDVDDLGIILDDIKLQNYNLALNFSRSPSRALGYKGMIDRMIDYPVFADLTFNAIVGELGSGSMSELVNKDNDFNISIILKDKRYSCTTLNIKQEESVSIRYDLVGAKFQEIAWSETVQSPLAAELRYTCQINPYDLSTGVFFSGVVMDSIQEAIGSKVADESGNFVTTEDGHTLILGFKIPPF